METNYNLILNADINKQLDNVIPKNPQTGLRDDIIHKYELALTDSERASLSQYLEEQQISEPDKQLSDSDLRALCPSRFVCSLVDARELANQMRRVVRDLDYSESVLNDSKPSVDNSSSADSSNSNAD